jgi:hypothetical protein
MNNGTREQPKSVRPLVKLVSFLVLLGFLAAVFFVGRWLVAYLRGLNSEVAKTLLPASIAVVGSVTAVAVGKYYEVRAAIWKELRDRKAPVYEQIVTRLFSIFFAEKMGEAKPTEADFVKFFVSSTEKLIVWGSDEVLVQFSRFRQLAITQEAERDSAKVMFLYEDFLRAIRADLGHKNKGVGRGEILRLFINDVDDVMGKETVAPSPESV